MGALIDLLNTVSASAVLLVAVLRYGPAAVLTVLAGMVAVLTRDPERGKRALEVLWLLHRPPSRVRRGRVALSGGSQPGGIEDGGQLDR